MSDNLSADERLERAFTQLQIEYERAKRELAEARDFIRWLWQEEVSTGFELDAGMVQDELATRGLIVGHTVTGGDPEAESGEYAPGDLVYRLADKLCGEGR